MINAGKYNKKIKIVKISTVEDNDGFVQENTSVIAIMWASVKTTRGYTLIANDTDFEKAYTNFTIRYPRTNITRDMFIEFKNERYSIEYLNNINEENIELEIQAKKVVK